MSRNISSQARDRAPDVVQCHARALALPGGGHQILVIGSEGADCVPYFARHGISTVILRERLRIDGYDMTTDAMDDTFQAIRLVCVSPPLRRHTVTN